MRKGFIALIVLLIIAAGGHLCLTKTGIIYKNESKVFAQETYPVISDLESKEYKHSNSDLRKFPYPYDAMLSICSDIDGTTLESFDEYHRFLNTKGNSIYGQGLGLDIGDSFWLFMGDKNDKPSSDPQKSVMTAFYGTDVNKIKDLNKIKYYYEKGWIDSLHTFGDFSEMNNELYIEPTRELDKEAWDVLYKYNIKPSIWINHGNEKNVQNFGGYSIFRITRYQQGDNPSSKDYHTDITIKNGIHFVWDSIGSDKFGSASPLYKLKLRDGQYVWGFTRYTNIYKKNETVWVWEPKDMDEEITKDDLDSIVRKNQYSIVTTHFGEGSLNEKGIRSLKTLSDYQNEGKILVARTSRLLNYAVAQNYVKYAEADYKGIRYINIKSIDDPIFGSITPSIENLRGITFYTNDSKKTVIMINYKPIPEKDIVYNESGRQTIGIKWFDADYTDYTKSEPAN